MKKKIVFFGDSNSNISTILFKQLIKEVSNSNFELVAVIDTTKNKPTKFFYTCFLFFIKKIFNPTNKYFFDYFHPFTSYKKDIPLIKAENINSAYFLNQIRQINPDYAILIGCPQIFKKELIKQFSSVINYHNSFLPQYRGLNATAWSMYFNEKETGFTYHYINEKVDDGNILLQLKFKIDYSKSVFEIEKQKTDLAKKQIEKLLKLIEQQAVGEIQKGKTSSFGTKEQESLVNFKNLNKKNFTQAEKVIQLFGAIKLNRKSENLFVTKVFNGKFIRIAFLPNKLFYILRFIKNSLCQK